MWDHYGVGQRAFEALEEPMRSELSAYAAGINAFYDQHPDDVPAGWQGSAGPYCFDERYADGELCDCGCGVVDPTCGTTEPVTCNFTWCGTDGGSGGTADPADHAMEPVVMDPEIVRCLGQAAAARVPDSWVEMPSAAGHDANMFAPHVPCGMLFIPSIGGVSHDFSEDSHEADIVVGCQVFADGVVDLLGR